MLNQDFREFIASLNANGVRYLIVGGYAVAFHGHPRYTKDLDVWIDPEPGNIRQLLSALADFGFAALNLGVSDFQEPDTVIQLGYPPNRIDLLTAIDGVAFPDCYACKSEVAIDGVPLNFIDMDNLKKNKAASARYQDLADLEHLAADPD